MKNYRKLATQIVALVQAETAKGHTEKAIELVNEMLEEIK